MEWKDFPDDAQLFADWQIAKTKIMLIEMLRKKADDETLYEVRYSRSKTTATTIEEILYDRHPPSKIESFLENGYPRAVKGN